MSLNTQPVSLPSDTLASSFFDTVTTASSSSTVGFWGQVDATVDWCEANYRVTPYIAEFWNTLSSLPMVFWALYGCYVTYRHSRCIVRDGRWTLAWILLASVGLGSAAFHATLRRHAQLLDEVPMLLGNLAFMFALAETASAHGKPRFWWLASFLVIVGVVEVFIYVILEWYSVFLLSYGGTLFLICVNSAYKLRRLSSPSSVDHHHHPDSPSLLSTGEQVCTNPKLRRLFSWSIGCYMFGLFLWSLENTYCKRFQHWNFHAIWHILAGYGTYLFIMWLEAMRGKAQRRKVLVGMSLAGHYIRVSVNGHQD